MVGETHSHRKADAELAERERRVRSLDIRPLDETAQAKYAGEWTAIQERFVDQPEQAVAQAGILVTSVMKDRGYPTEDHDQILADLSVEHANTLDHYRQAHQVSLQAEEGSASTEDLRLAMLHYRALFGDLLGQPANAQLANAQPANAEPDAAAADSEPVVPTPRTGRRRANPAPAAGGTTARTLPAVGSAALAAHVQPDDGPGRLAGPDLHEITAPG